MPAENAERRFGHWRVPVSQRKGPGEDGQEELFAAFAALGGPLSRDEFMQVPRDTFMRLLGSPSCRTHSLPCRRRGTG
jgi:hypothetical protein